MVCRHHDHIYPRIMSEVNVSAKVGMSTTVGEMFATVWANVHDSWGMSATVGEMSAIVGKLNMI